MPPCRKTPGSKSTATAGWPASNNFRTFISSIPPGPGPPPGLYRSGLTYLELHKHSFLEADRQKGVAIFQEVIQRYPQSRYTPLSRSQLAALGKPQSPPRTTAATRHLKSAHAAYEALLANSTRQNHRDRWEACIDRFQAAYRADVSGPHAAEALYMIGKLYQGLAGRSYRQADRDTAADYFKRVAGDFPGTAYAEKALAELPGQPSGAGTAGTAGADPLAGIIAQYQADEAAPDASDPPAERGGLVTVQGLRFWSNPSYTRIVVDANQETGFTHHLLKKDPAIQKPQRLYIDMNNSRLVKTSRK
jgi:N-acetylmuramoyl-L-alanine amidase